MTTERMTVTAGHTTFHASMTIGHALRSLYNGTFTDPDGTVLNADEARDRLHALLQEGVRVIPFGEPCEGFSPTAGCPGHTGKATP